MSVLDALLKNLGVPVMSDEKKEEPEQPPEDIVYALSTMFDDKQIEEKLEILGDFISRINSIGV